MNTQSYLEQMAEHLKSWSQRVDDLRAELTQPQASEGRQAYIDQMAEYLDGWSQRMNEARGKITPPEAGSDSPEILRLQKVLEKQQAVESELQRMRESGEAEFSARRESLESAIGGLGDAFREALAHYK